MFVYICMFVFFDDVFNADTNRMYFCSSECRNWPGEFTADVGAVPSERLRNTAVQVVRST